MPLVNRPAQSFGIVYDESLTNPTALANIAMYAQPGGLLIAARRNYDHPSFHAVSEAGGCVIIYLDAMIDNPTGRYHNYLLGRHDNGTPDAAFGALVPRWPGEPQANEFGYINDFRVGGVLQGKLEGVLQMMVAENPHMGGFFMDDVGTRSWFQLAPWDDFSPTEQQQYRDGAIAICQTVRRVCDEHGLIFIVNGTWGQSSTGPGGLEFGGGYPNMAAMGCSLADGGFVENHDASQLPYFIPYSNSTQWASESAVTNGVAFNLAVNKTDPDTAAYIASNAYAYAVNQPNYAYPVPPGTLHPTGLPSRVRSSGYTELEWNLKVQAPAALGETYQFRVLAGDVRLDDYPLVPALTIGPTVPYHDETLSVAASASVAVTDESTATDHLTSIHADALYLGTQLVDKVYAGATRVW